MSQKLGFRINISDKGFVDKRKRDLVIDMFVANKMESKHTQHSEKHNDMCVLDMVSEILLQIIEDHSVFNPKNEEKCVNETVQTLSETEDEDFNDEGLTSENQCIQLNEDGNILQHSQLAVKEISLERHETTLNTFDIHSKIQDLLNSKGNDDYDKEENNSCEKKQLLTALHLSPALKDFDKEKDKCDLDFAEKKKESVHFTSPVAVFYEFSEKSEASSDGSTDILSDSDSQDLILSQNESIETSELDLENRVANSHAINNVQDRNLTLYVGEDSLEDKRDCIMTPGGDCFNVKLFANFDAVTDPLEIETANDCNQNALSPKSFNNGTLVNHLELSQKGKEIEKVTVTVADNLKPIDDNSERQDSKNVFESSEETCYSETIAQDISIGKRNDYKVNRSNHTNITEESLVLPNLSEPNCIVADFSTVENKTESNDSCISEVFTKFSLDKEESKVELSQDMFIELNQTNTTEEETIDKSDINSPQHYINGGGKDFDNFPVNKSIEQDLVNQKIYENIQVEIEKEQDIINTAEECEFKDEKVEPSQQCAETSMSTEVDALAYSEIENSDMAGIKSSQKREQSSPELNCSQVIKKSRSGTAVDLTSKAKKRKLFKFGLNECRKVKLLKLDFEYDETDLKKVPKMLKQLASDVIAGLDENVIFECNKEELTTKQENINEAPDGHSVSITVDISGNFENEMKEDSFDRQDKISTGDLCLSDCEKELQQEYPKALGLCNSGSNQNSKLLNKSNDTGISEDTTSILLETSEIGCLNEEHFLESQNFPRCTDTMSATKALSQHSDENCNETHCLFESDQSVPVIDGPIHMKGAEDTDSFQLETAEELHNKQHVYPKNLLSPKFMTATELLSQSSEESGSTGFTVNATDPLNNFDLQDQDSLENSEVIQINNIAEFGINPIVQEQRPVVVATFNHNPKSVVEITEDGLMEEKLENTGYDMIVSSCEIKGNVKSLDVLDRNCAATDQDEQIDTDQLDVYIDGIVDQIVPDDKYEGEPINRGEEHTMFTRKEDKKSEVHRCGPDVCVKEDNTACQQIKTQGMCFWESQYCLIISMKKERCMRNVSAGSIDHHMMQMETQFYLSCQMKTKLLLSLHSKLAVNR
ncbi:uncharacterized protein LOC132740593 isoform X2 [Ruditapes philippinarum]|uniref:uncharacterized protein LOC132740593 isoform X2 n=1 Tax=Ruditapes philippinarum TaxID=129788 RepID=UPI00295A9FE1|nr:uncharacterized protein LOC132740593 isoform X2 [Ruditapes philippinarum]